MFPCAQNGAHEEEQAFGREAHMNERRTELRRRTLLTGRLAAKHLTTLNCLVRDLSPHGARLKCRTTGLNDEVSLEITSIAGFRKDTRIVWRRLEDCGVQFVERKPAPCGPPVEAPVPSDGC
jgi:PilZ domain